MATASLKEQHEIAIGDNLFRSLRLSSHFCGHGKDNGEPDLIYSVEGRKIGVEVATAYYHNDYAKVLWQSARGILKPLPNRETRHFRRTIGDADKVITSRVQQELDDKCSKTYFGVDAVWLCIAQQASLASVSETEILVRTVKVPPKHSFERVYLGFHASLGDGGGFRVYDLLSA